MPLLASDCFTTAKGRLNDLSGALYTDTNLLPYLQDAYEELQNELAAIDAEVLEEVTSPTITVAIGVTSLGAGGSGQQPSDMVVPVSLYERTPGSSERFVEMGETRWEPQELQTNTLRKWNWREEEIKFLGSLAAREVKIQYIKSLTAIVGPNSAIAVAGSKLFLGFRTAAGAALSIGENPTRSKSIDDKADMYLAKLLARVVRRQQAMPVRRRVNRYRVR